MLATDILTQDHAQVLSLIEELAGVRNDERGNRETFTKLEESLLLHMRQEEEIYYTALAEHEEFSDIIEENVPEHEAVRENLSQMRELSVVSDLFQSLLAEIRSALKEHMRSEEDDIFPRSVEVLGRDRINELGTQIDELKGDTGISQSARM